MSPTCKVERFILSCKMPAATSAEPKMSVMVGSGNAIRAKPALIKNELFPLLHSF